MRSRLALALASLLGVIAIASSAPTHVGAAQTEGTVGIRLLDAPTDRADDPRARLYIVDHLAPGTTINRRVEVQNNTNETQPVQLYAAAADVEGGDFNFGEGRTQNDLTSWTTVSPSSVTLEPGDRGVATVTIAVPSDATAGERYGVIWAELRAAPTAEEGIGAVNRVGIRMYVSIGPGGEPPTDFEIRDFQGRRAPDGSPVLEARIDNTGGRALDLSGQLRLTEGPGGLSAGPFDVEPGTTVGVGQSAPVRVTLDPALPFGPWLATLEMRSGTTTREASATISFPDELGGVSGPEVGGLPWALFIALLLLLLLLLWLLLLAWRRRKKDDDEEGPAVAATA